MDDLKVAVDFTDIHTLKRELLGIQKSARESASVFNTAWNQAEAQLKKTNAAFTKNASASQEYYAKLLKINQGTTDAAKSGAVFEKALAAEAKQMENLKLKYNATYKSATQFKTTLRELNTAHQDGAISTANHSIQVEQLKNDYRSFLNGTAGWSNQFVTGANRAGKSLNKFGMYSQQFGYQMSDFVVQVQGGTSAFVAFGQQGAQLFGLISGPWGAALSIGAALIGGFGAALMKSKDQMAEAETGAKGLEERIKGINSEVDKYFRNQEALSKGITPEEQDLDKQIDIAKDAAAEAKKLVDDLQLAMNAAQGQHGSVGVALKLAWDARSLEAREEELKEANENLNKLLQKQAEETAKAELEAGLDGVQKLLEAETEAQKASGEAAMQIIKDREDAETSAANKLQELRFASGQAIADSLVAETQEMEKQHLAAKAVADEIMNAYNNGEDLSKIDLKTPIQGWADVALLLAQRMGSAAAAAAAINESKEFGMNTGTPLSLEDATTPPRSNIKNWYKPSKSGGGSRKETQEEYLAKLEREIEIKRETLGVYGDEREIMQEVAKLKEQVIKKDYDISESKLEQIVREGKALEDRMRIEQDLYDSVTSTINDSLMDLVKGATSVEEAFKNMLFNIVEQIYQAQVVDPLAKSAGSFLTNLIGGITKTQANGGAWSNGVQMFAKGGVVSSATMFGHSGGLGVMGEAGPEAIMPLKRGSDGKLGVAASGGNGGSQDVIIHQNFTFAANGDESVKRIIAEAAPSIAEMTKRQVLQARLRGGQFKAAFK